MNSKALRPALALLLLFVLAPLLRAQSPPGPPPGPPGDTMKSLQEIWEEIVALKAQNAAEIADLKAQLSALSSTPGSGLPVELVDVLNAGNAPDPSNSGDVPGIGAVAYPYRIGKYEVTNAQYAQFLNAVAVTDPNALYHTSMGSNARGGITRSGASSSYSYVVKAAMGDKPVNYVSWYDALRFCNWLHNGQPNGERSGDTTEGGAYTLTSTTTIAAGTDPTHGANGRNAGARFWLPSESEWYKAAYYQPSGQGGDAESYWLYPTRSIAVPTVATADATGNINNDTANIVNYSRGADWNGQDGNVTTVGSGGPGSQSFYGAFDMGGNVWEWNEQTIGGDRGLRGGSWGLFSFNLQSSFRNYYNPSFEFDNIGFRVAGP
jgi:formylglycine-generating enzyme required for sulfatase activity